MYAELSLAPNGTRNSDIAPGRADVMLSISAEIAPTSKYLQDSMTGSSFVDDDFSRDPFGGRPYDSSNLPRVSLVA